MSEEFTDVSGHGSRQGLRADEDTHVTVYLGWTTDVSVPRSTGEISETFMTWKQPTHT